jgi:toxin-antitoxin system PIN domain toxin
MRALLDVNVLIALFDPDHAFHSRARDWWDIHAESGWATCPLTENAAIRIITNRGYSVALRFSAEDVLDCFRGLIDQSDHQFWPDSISFRDSTLFHADRLHSSNALPDLYLLGLAVRNSGTLVTFDSNIPLLPVVNAAPANLTVIR